MAPSRARALRPASTGCPPAGACTSAATPVALAIPCSTLTGTGSGAAPSDWAGHRQVAPDRPGRCDLSRRHPRRGAGGAGLKPHPGGSRPTPPSSGCSAGRSRRATDRRPWAEYVRPGERSGLCFDHQLQGTGNGRNPVPPATLTLSARQPPGTPSALSWPHCRTSPACGATLPRPRRAGELQQRCFRLQVPKGRPDGSPAA